MPLTASFMDGHAAKIVAGFPQSISWGGTSYACTADDLTNVEDPELAGYMADATILFHIRLALFTDSRPAVGDQITYGSTVYRVLSAVTSVGGVWLDLACTDKDQR